MLHTFSHIVEHPDVNIGGNKSRVTLYQSFYFDTYVVEYFKTPYYGVAVIEKV